MEEKVREIINKRPVREAAQEITFTEEVNVSESERFISVLIGVLLALIALLRRSWSSIIFLLTSNYLIFRGLTGYCMVYRLLGLRSISRSEKRQIERGERAKYQSTELSEAMEADTLA